MIPYIWHDICIYNMIERGNKMNRLEKIKKAIEDRNWGIAQNLINEIKAEFVKNFTINPNPQSEFSQMGKLAIPMQDIIDSFDELEKGILVDPVTKIKWKYSYDLSETDGRSYERYEVQK